MQTQSSNWLEVVKVVAPYTTAIVAIMASVLTAWLAHRNWMKQFLVEKSFVFRDEQRSMLREIPSNLIQAANLAVQSLLWQAIFSAIQRLASEGKVPYDQEKIDKLVENQDQAVQQLNSLLIPLYTARITSRVYFGEDAGRSVESCLAKLQEIIVPGVEYKSAENKVYGSLKAAINTRAEITDAITPLVNEVRRELSPLIDRVGNEVAKLVRLMIGGTGGENPR